MEVQLIKICALGPLPTNISPDFDVNTWCATHSGAPGHQIKNCKTSKHKVQHLLDAGAFVFTPNGLYRSIHISSATSGIVIPSQREIPKCHSQLVLLNASSQQSLLVPSCKNQLINQNWHHLNAHADHQGPNVS